MGIRRSMEERICVAGFRNIWLQNIEKTLQKNGFKNVTCDPNLYQLKGDYKNLTVWGEVVVTLLPFGNNDNQTEINIKSTANVDNIYALFKSPNKTIIEAVKTGLKIMPDQTPISVQKNSSFCANCGVELQENSRFCNACGTNLSTNTQTPIPTSSSSKNISMGAIIATIIGAIGALFSIMTIQSDINQWRFTYTSPFTGHETGMIAVTVISIIVLISGIVAIYKSKH